MKTKSFITTSLRAAILVLTLGSAWACRGQYNPFLIEPRAPGSRAQRFESYLIGQYWNSDDITFPSVTLPIGPGPNPPLATGDLKFEFDDAGFWGLGTAYHLNSYFAVSGEFTFGYPDYRASFNGTTLRGEAFINAGKFNVDYHILNRPVTPFVSAGLGYLYFDSGIPSGPPNYYYWWDYWWGGYVVTVSQPTYDKTWFTLDAQAGLRWDITDQFYLKASGGANWVYVGSGSGWLTTLQGTFSVGWKF